MIEYLFTIRWVEHAIRSHSPSRLMGCILNYDYTGFMRGKELGDGKDGFF